MVENKYKYRKYQINTYEFRKATTKEHRTKKNTHLAKLKLCGL